MNPLLKYAAGRAAILCSVLAVVSPLSMNIIFKCAIALFIAGLISHYALRPWRDEMADWIAARRSK